MGGAYQSKESHIRDFLQRWIYNSIAQKSWNTYNDIHVDEIPGSSKERTMWLDESLYILNIFVELVDLNKYEVLLAIPLRFSKKRYDLNFLKSIKKIKSRLHFRTPPSFYLFPKETEAYELTKKNSLKISHLPIKGTFSAFFKEEMDEGVYERTLFISSNML